MSKRYKCPYCDIRKERKDLIIHVDKNHKDLLPEGYSGARIIYDKLNNITDGHGSCRVCKKPTTWNDTSGRYNVLCGSNKCKDYMREEYRKNMIKIYNTDNILKDPEQQKKMLANRKISGLYTFSDGGKVGYTGSYEYKCLEFLDIVMRIQSSEIITPGPVLYYEYKGKKHLYLPDIYYPNFNLLIEIKDGQDNPNNKQSPGMIASREKTIEKERMITDKGIYNYIRLTNNDFSQLIEIFMQLKYNEIIGDKSKVIRVNESNLNTINKSSMIESATINNIPTVYLLKSFNPEIISKAINNLIPFKYYNNLAVKLHSGEEGNQNFLQPEFWKATINSLNGTVVECNTAYNGSRNTTDKHMQTMVKHGWSNYFAVDILDSDKPDIELQVNKGNVLDTNLVGNRMKNYDVMLVLSHFKGHPMGGFGGSLKNISIGLASSDGKCKIHRAPIGTDMFGFKDYDQNEFIEAMAEAAGTILEYYNDNIFFVNVMKNLSVDCDCCAEAEDPCMKDIGVLLSTDPVALDSACLDLIYNSNDVGKEHFIERVESRNGTHIIEHAISIGIGSRDYILKDITDEYINDSFINRNMFDIKFI